MTDAASPWNPDQYARFKDERSRPVFDLLALVTPRPDMRAVDLGCGTGELTRELHVRLAARETTGVEASESMLAKSGPFAGAGAGLRFVHARIEDWEPSSPLDLVFSNAALHWVDDHPALLARLARMLAPGGQLAVQIPSNDDHPAHLVAAEVAREPPFRDALAGYVRVFPNLSLEGYARALDSLGFPDPHVRMQVYGHHLESREEVVEWVKGSLLTDYAKRLSPEMFAQYVARNRELLMSRLGPEKQYFFPCKRTQCWARRP